MTSRGRGRGRGGRRGRGGNRALGRNPEDLVLTRHQMLNRVGGGTGFTVNIVPFPYVFTGGLVVMRQYTEYCITRLTCRMQTSTSSTAQGVIWGSFSFISPETIDGSFDGVSQMAGFRVGGAHDCVLNLRLPRGAQQQRFYPILQDTPTDEQLRDPNIIQCWFLHGSDGINAAFPAAYYISITYTIVLRGPARGSTAAIPTLASIANWQNEPEEESEPEQL